MSADVDLVMMSKASDPSMAAMTQRAIDSALDNADASVSVTVLEQNPTFSYRRATVVEAPGAFNYNEFCNRGAKLGSAPWIVFANNDLRFERFWAKHLMQTGHPVMSPYNPRYHRHHNCHANEMGWQVGRHLSGWCYMMVRSLWEELGGLDETYPFWCADNAVMDQLRANGIQPMLVRAAVVHHTLSMTLQREDRATQDELTWAAVHRYNQTAEHSACSTDPRYHAWQRRTL